MFDDQNTVGDTSGGQLSSKIANGMTVYDAVGDKVGTVHDYEPGAGYLDVHKGWLFPKDFFVPLSAVNTTEVDAVYLNLTKDDLSGEQYETPPAGAVSYVGGANTGADYTTAATSRYNVADVDTTGELAVDDERDIRIPVREEELVAGSRTQEQGRVHIHKDVIEEQQSINVPLTQERVTVERVPYSGSADAISGDDAFVDRDIEVPVMGQEVVAEKRTRGVEEVRIRKDAFTENVPFSDTVRKERVTVDADPDDLVTDKTTGVSAKRMVDRTEDAASSATTDAERAARDL